LKGVVSSPTGLGHHQWEQAQTGLCPLSEEKSRSLPEHPGQYLRWSICPTASPFAVANDLILVGAPQADRLKTLSKEILRRYAGRATFEVIAATLARKRET